MQLGDLPSEKVKDDDPSVTSIIEDKTERLKENTNQLSSKSSENILKPVGEVKDEVSAANYTQKKQKGSSKVVKFIFSVLIVLAIVSFGIAVSLYLIRFFGNGGQSSVEQNNTAVLNGFGALNSSSNSTPLPTGSLDSNNTDEYNFYVINTLDNGLKEYYNTNGKYPWDNYGDKPIPAMNKIMNSVSKPNYSWLEETSDFNDFVNLTEIFQNSSAVSELRVFGFASWYAFCFAPTTQEYISKASFDKFAEDIGEGSGDYVCVRSSIEAVKEN